MKKSRVISILAVLLTSAGAFSTPSIPQHSIPLSTLSSDPVPEDAPEAKLKIKDLECLILNPITCPTANASIVRNTTNVQRREAAPLFGLDQNFELLREAYPQGSSCEVKRLIGHGDMNWITNTCVIRVSYALNKSGIEDAQITVAHANRARMEIISHRENTADTCTERSAQGNITDKTYLTDDMIDNETPYGPYGFRVLEFVRYMVEIYGRPQIIKSRSDNFVIMEDMRADFIGEKGIILFVVNWSDATGHFDLWDGERAVGSEYFERATHVMLWK